MAGYGIATGLAEAATEAHEVGERLLHRLGDEVAHDVRVPAPASSSAASRRATHSSSARQRVPRRIPGIAYCSGRWSSRCHRRYAASSPPPVPRSARRTPPRCRSRGQRVELLEVVRRASGGRGAGSTTVAPALAHCASSSSTRSGSAAGSTTRTRLGHDLEPVGTIHLVEPRARGRRALSPNGAQPSPSSTARCERSTRPAADPERHVLVRRRAAPRGGPRSRSARRGTRRGSGPIDARSARRASSARSPRRRIGTSSSSNSRSSVPTPTPSTSRPPAMRSRVP